MPPRSRADAPRTTLAVRILLDHNLPFKLRTALAALNDHEFVTASYMGWGELRNGDLLAAAENYHLDVFVTGDQTLIYGQNQQNRQLAIVILTAQNWPIIRNRVAMISDAIHRAAPGSIQAGDCGAFSRRNTPRPQGSQPWHRALPILAISPAMIRMG